MLFFVSQQSAPCPNSWGPLCAFGREQPADTTPQARDSIVALAAAPIIWRQVADSTDQWLGTIFYDSQPPCPNSWGSLCALGREQPADTTPQAQDSIAAIAAAPIIWGQVADSLIQPIIAVESKLSSDARLDQL